MSYFVIIRGPLGCGKSTVAERLAGQLGAKHYPMDKILDEQGLTMDKEDGYISQQSFITANEIVAPEANNLLKHGMPVIFDGNFYWKSQIEDLTKRLNYPFRAFTLKASLKTCIERDKARKKAYGIGAVTAVYRKSTEFDYGIGIDTEGKTVEETVKKILHQLPLKKR